MSFTLHPIARRIGRQRRRKVLVKQLGRGISETTVANGEDV